MTKLRAAIVGAGLMGRWHATYAARAGAEIAAIVDVDAGAAAALGGRFPAAIPLPSLDECLLRREVDVVHVCTGLASHVLLAETALRAGKHVLVEKPAASSAAEVRRLGEMASRAGLRLSAVHQMPFQRGFERLSRDRPLLGALVALHYVGFTAGGEGRAAPERRAVLLEILPHAVSLFRALLGEDGAGALQPIGFTDDDLEMAGCHRDIRLAVTLSLRARPTRNELVVAGTGATAVVDLYHGYVVIDRASVSRTSKVLAPFRLGSRRLVAAGANLVRRALAREPAYPGLRPLIERFYASVRGGAPPPVTVDEMVEAALVMERAAATARA